MQKNSKFLIIQTAFIGDVILATPIIENIHTEFPNAEIHFCLRKGNESLLHRHPFVSKIISWDKKEKYSSLFRIIREVRNEKYDYVFCVQRFFNTGLITLLSNAKQTIGFDKNPLSFLFSKAVKHEFKEQTHETARNCALLKGILPIKSTQPKLYTDHIQSNKLTTLVAENFICIAPASVWFTKQFPVNKWIEFVNAIKDLKIYILGAPSDDELANEIIHKSSNKRIQSLCGKLNLLESAFLMKQAKMNFVNDSAPMHLASAVNANVSAIFCSTVPAFGFGPLSKNSTIIETNQNLACRPCGLHGKKQCPKNHFNCAQTIKTEQLVNLIQ